MDEYDKARLPIIKEFIGSIGEKYYFRGPIQFNYGTHTFIGNNFFANFNLMVMDDARIYIGDNVMFGPNVSLMATNHPLIAKERIAMKYDDGHVSVSEYADEIHIGNNVWIASNVVILGGVTIGDGAVIGAGSVVTKDIPAGYVTFGSPCKPKRKITEELAKYRASTMLVVTHEISFAIHVADRIVLMDKGSIVEEGLPEVVFSNPMSSIGRQYKELIEYQQNTNARTLQGK